jgi:LysM repeat protein
MKAKFQALGILICLVFQLVMGVSLAEGADPVHVVRRGDTLYSVARRYGTTVNAIVRANGLRDSNRIYVGQRLIVPTSEAAQQAATSGIYVVQRGDTLYSIARRHGVSVQALARANSIYNPNLIRRRQRLVIPGATAASSYSSSGSVHVVRRGENLFRIALRYGTTVQALALANNLSRTSLIYVGQRLVIPGRGSASPPPTPSSVSAPTSGKWIDINLATQSLVAYEGQRAVYSATVSTGLARTPTPKGRFRIYRKIRSTRMSGPGYNLPNVPYVMYFRGGYSIHGTYWHNNFGRPMSHGCVNMRIADAQWLYNWAPVGTPVVIY